MPLLIVQTNKSEGVSSGFLREATKQLAEMLGKPEKVVMVKLETGCEMSFGGTAETTALAELKSIGMPADATPTYAEKLSAYLSKQLDIPKERIFITFSSFERHMWAWNGKTFAG